MAIEVEQLSTKHDAELVAFLDDLGNTTPSVLGYHYPFYRDMLVSVGVGQPLYLGARLDGRLAGVLPVMTRSAEAGTVYCSLPFFGPNGGVLCDREGPDRSGVQAALLKAMLDRARDERALGCTIYTPFLGEDYDPYDAQMPDALIVERFTQCLDLADTDWKGTLARNLRRASKAGIEVRTDITPERIDAFYAIYERNCADIGMMVKPRVCVDALLGGADPGRHVSIYFGLLDGQVVAGLMVLWSPLVASYYIPCSLAEVRSLQPGSLLIDQAMKDARSRGVRIWNWESSPSRDGGVYRFKQKWGSRESGYRIYVVPLAGRRRFREISADGLARQFPYFFVYPYDRLADAHSDDWPAPATPVVAGAL